MRLFKNLPFLKMINSYVIDLSVPSKSYSTDSSVRPVKKYANADREKLQIIKDNKGKAGVYCWRNLKNGKRYIGSSTNLERRFK